MKRIVSTLLLLCLLFMQSPARSQAEPAINWYEIFVRSYQDSDGDGIGDLQGVIGRLDDLVKMGYTGIWLMPVFPSPSYHKYDVSDYMQIDQSYGTLDDFRSLIQKAHEYGIQIIIDLPLNHTSVNHPWFQEAVQAIKSGVSSPYLSYYCFRNSYADGYTQLDGSDWFYEERFAGGGMPDLNLDEPAVRQEITRVISFWLGDMRVDGFRLDAVTNLYTGQTERNIEFLSWLNQTCKQINPEAYLVGECWADLSTIAQYYSSGIDSFFLFPASQAEGFLISSLRGRSGHAEKFAKQYERVLNAIPQGILAPFLCNHDTGRTIGAVQGRSNLPAAKFIEGLLNMLNGNVFTYYGEEIGMVGSGEDPNKRLAMYWNDHDMTQQPPGVTKIEYAYPAYDVQILDPNSLLQYCINANHLRLQFPEISTGINEFIYVDGDICLMKRTTDDSSCLIAVNFSSKDHGECEIPENWSIAGVLTTTEAMPSMEKSCLRLPPYSIVVLDQTSGQ